MMREEIFGPILPVISFKNFDEVIAVGEKSMVPLKGIKGDLFEDKNKNIEIK